MDLNRKAAFKMSANEIDADNENDAAIDLDEVNMGEFWERVELNIVSKAFSPVTLKSLSLKSNLYFWVQYIGKKTRQCINVLNTEHQKIRQVHESAEVQDECKEMNDERLLETLSNDTLKKVKKAAR